MKTSNKFFLGILILSIFYCGCQSTSERLNEEGMVLIRQGRYQEAADKFSQACQADSKSPQAHILLAQTQLVLKQPESSLQTIEKILQHRPDLLEAKILKIQIYYSMGQDEQGKDLLQSLSKKYPKHPKIYMLLVLLGEEAFAKKDWPKGISWFDQAIEMAPNESLPHVQKGRALLFMEMEKFHRENSQISQKLTMLPFLPGQVNLDAAKAEFRKAIYKNRQDFDAHLMLALLALQGGEHSEAEVEIQEAYRLRPNNVIVLLAKAVNQQQLKNYLEAEKLFATITQDHPELAEPILLYASLKIDQKQYEQAVRLFLGAIKKFPEVQPQIYSSLETRFAENFSWMVELLAHKDKDIQNFVAQGLAEVTKQPLSLDANFWKEWWKAQQQRYKQQLQNWQRIQKDALQKMEIEKK